MKTKSNIVPTEKIQFVHFVVETSKVDEKYEPALFDYAFRAAYTVFFTDIDVAGVSQEEVNSIIYSDEITEKLMERNPVIVALEQACREKIQYEQQRELELYKKEIHPDPLNRIADIFEALAKEIKEKIDPDAIMDAVIKKQEKKQIAKTGKRKNAKPRLTVAPSPKKD